MSSTFPDAPDPKPSDIDDLITVQEFANQYRVDASIVRSWVKMGYINYVLVGPRKMRKIRKSEILKPIEPGGSNGQQSRSSSSQQGSNSRGANRR